jgi:hypothetical protein
MRSIMTTAKQLAANRLNAQKSTGPRTPQGKATSRYNAVKYGIFAVSQIMFGETAEDLAELCAEYHERFSPVDAQERLLVDTLVHNEWRLRRMRGVEASLWENARDKFLLKNSEAAGCTSGDAFAAGSEQFLRVQRVVNSCERNYHRASKELHRLQLGRDNDSSSDLSSADLPSVPLAEPAPASQSEQFKTSSANLASSGQNAKSPLPVTSESTNIPWPQHPQVIFPITSQHMDAASSQS